MKSLVLDIDPGEKPYINNKKEEVITIDFNKI
jgi:hypothetical protein